MARHLWSLIVLALTACLSSAQVSADSRAGFSDATLEGEFLISTTLRPYVKFGGGPRVSSAEIQFDGHGGLSGEGSFFNERTEMHGTYHINSDGTGTASYDARSDTGHIDHIDLDLHVINADEIKFQSPGWQNRDWSSAMAMMQTGKPGLVGEMRRKKK